MMENWINNYCIVLGRFIMPVWRSFSRAKTRGKTRTSKPSVWQLSSKCEFCKILDSKAHFGKVGREMLFQNTHLSIILPNSLSQKAIRNSHILIKGKNCKYINDGVGRGNLNLSSLHTPRQVIVKTLISTTYPLSDLHPAPLRARMAQVTLLTRPSPSVIMNLPFSFWGDNEISQQQLPRC